MKRLALILGLLVVFFIAATPVNAQTPNIINRIENTINKDNICVKPGFWNLCPTCILSCQVNGEDYRCDTVAACITKQQEVASSGTTSSGENIAPGSAACRFISGDKAECTACFDDGGAWTAIGCIGRGGDPSDFVTTFMQIGVGMGGGIAFLLILFAGLQTMMSAGNPEKLHAARELMGAAISGLLLIIFSIFLLRLIGVDILGLPTFSQGYIQTGPGR